jgi:hypothetical protein
VRPGPPHPSPVDSDSAAAAPAVAVPVIMQSFIMMLRLAGAGPGHGHGVSQITGKSIPSPWHSGWYPRSHWQPEARFKFQDPSPVWIRIRRAPAVLTA